ncbi:MAG: aminomethyltransferase family protein [Candidatus Methylomirabilales bacterium]
MTHRSRLYDLHQSLGAAFRDQGGWALPDRYQDPVQEHRAVREAVGVLDLSFRTLYRVTGADRTRFLNGMLTNDLSKLEEGQGCYACILTPQGKIVADLEVYALRDCHLLELDARWKEGALDHLNKYVIADDVTFEELDHYTLLAVQGPGAPILLGRVLPGASLPGEEQRCVEVTLDNHVCRVIRASITGEDGYKLATPQDRAEVVWQTFQEGGATPAGMAALNSLRLEAGIPWFGVDFNEGNFPQEAGIEDKAVSFTKGCYIGQEFVIRIAHRGHVNRRTSGLTIGHEPIPRPGDRVLHGDKEVGHITSAALSPTLGTIVALGMLRRESQEPGTVVHVESQGERRPAEVTPLPFYRRHAG